MSNNRIGRVDRETKESSVQVTFDIDGTGVTDISTGIGFFDHMLRQLGKHGLFDLSVHTKGDLHIDAHHTVEDTSLALGEAFAIALGDKSGLRRFGQARGTETFTILASGPRARGAGRPVRDN